MSTLPNPLKPALPSGTLGLSEAILSSSVEQILQSIESALQKIVPHDYAAIAVRDAQAGGQLRQRELSSQRAASGRETVLPIERTPPGWVLTHRRPLLVSEIDHTKFPQSADQAEAAMRFGCWLPLICRGEAVGALLLGSRDDAHLEQRVVDLLSLAPQIAGALEITENFRQIVAFTDRLQGENLYLSEHFRSEQRFENVVGVSAAFRGVMDQVRTASSRQQAVLIKGEIGTEKELIARLIHQQSSRRHQMFVKVDCGAYPPQILARKLFGHGRQDSSCASSGLLGWSGLAHEGTLFLEEVGDLPVELQSRLVGVLHERRSARRQGQSRTRLDIRAMASTSRDLLTLVNLGKFNRELYLWLSSSPIQIAPLRRRAEDIPLLVNQFVGKFAKQMNKTIDHISPETMDTLVRWHWPGNLKELENFIERSVMLTTGSTLRIPRLELDVAAEQNLLEIERQHILRILRDTGGVIGGPGGAAERLGIKRTTLNSMIKKLGIQRSTNR
jgi:transcriptional regulator with GAF, ATPase, and Fis domain